jgi:catechol 2,3-dioxygenase-like lactoylglutathione lyase family enzyme
MNASPIKTYEQATLRTAFCILPQNLDEHLAFYTGVLGLEVIRRDEGFVRFNTTPAIICLWEIGHIHKHLGFANPGPVVASKSIVVLDVPSEAVADRMATGCHARGLEPMAILGAAPGVKGFTVRDPNACYWTIQVKASAGPAHVERFGTIAEDFDKSVAFYRDVMNLRPVGTSTLDIAHFAASDVVSFDILRRSSIPDIAPLTDVQRSAHLTMPALGYRLCAEVDAAAARLRRGGARLTADPVKHEWNFYVAYFTDPDANIWEIFTPLPEGTTSTI